MKKKLILQYLCKKNVAKLCRKQLQILTKIKYFRILEFIFEKIVSGFSKIVFIVYIFLRYKASLRYSKLEIFCHNVHFKYLRLNNISICKRVNKNLVPSTSVEVFGSAYFSKHNFELLILKTSTFNLFYECVILRKISKYSSETCILY